MGVMMGARDEETVSSLAGRLARLGQQLTKEENSIVKENPTVRALNRFVVPW